MSRIVQLIKGNRFLALIVLTYMALLIVVPQKAIEAVSNSMYYIKEMFIIMPVILLLTSLIEAWVPKKTIENAFGMNSGIKGSIFSFLLGSLSAGPIYAAFPVCKALLKKGASVTNIVIILSVWAVIKVPMLANEAKFLGSEFMITRWVLTTIAIFAIAFITSNIVKKYDIPSLEEIEANGTENVIKINYEYCIGCGLCKKMAPNYFELSDKKAFTIKKVTEVNEKVLLYEVMDKCPAKVIYF